MDPVKKLTKRNLLSETSNLFDALGWLEPLIIQFKIPMQQTWVRGLSWDDLVPDISATWNDLQSSLSAIHDIQIPRAIINNTIAELEIHLFSDASEKAYAAVVYSRATDNLGNVSTSLLSPKTRVAPVKTFSLPRLELFGAELASKLASTFMKIFEVLKPNVTLFAWTDSTIVLHWLSQLPRTWTTFVANKLSSTRRVLPRSNWRHVSSLEDPADLASRGCSATQVFHSHLWWFGPTWLSVPTTE